MQPLQWQYGITTVPPRLDTTLPPTLQSLKLAGFPSPRLFVDQWNGEDVSYHHLGLEVTYHQSSTATSVSQGELQPFGNWYLALWELWIRNPTAHRYALFQDDFVCVRNLRQYLEACTYPKRGYLNLFTAFKLHEMLVEGKEKGWHEGGLLNPPDRNPGLLQKGLGAVALVFNNEAVQVLLSSPTMRDKPKAADKLIRYRKVDGGIVTAMNLAGWREYVHNPSLVQHIGTISSCGNNDTQGKCKHPQALTFPGEQFDAMSLVRGEHATT